MTVVDRLLTPTLTLVLICATAALSGCQSPPPAAPMPPPIAEAPPAPPIALPSKVIEAASVYRAYVERAAAISPKFDGGDSVAATLRLAESYEQQQFQQGQIAYAAVIALQDPAFVASVRAFAIDASQRNEIAAQILKDPAYAAGFKGADSAAGLIVAALSDQGARVLSTGRKVKQAAYDVQHQAWSKASVANRDSRLAEAKSLSAVPLKADMDDAARLRQASSGAAPLGLSAPAAAAPYTPVVSRGLAIAALAALGLGGDEYFDQIAPLLVEKTEAGCLNMAKLNLYQCLAVSKPHYEDVFCLGQHILMDTGQCILKGATPSGVPSPAGTLATAGPANMSPMSTAARP